MIRKIAYIILVFIFVSSCTDEPVETVFFNLDTENGVFITCEGNFMYGNASLSFYNSATKTVLNQLFYARNNAPLGDVAQSMTLFRNTLFVVGNNSGKVYAVNPETIEFKGAIRGLTSPRYVHVISENKAYISDLYAHDITVIHPETLQVTGKVELSEKHTSEQMVQVGDSVFATSWSYDKYLLVIDAVTDKLVEKIELPLQPKNLVVDKNSKIWALSDGGFEGSPAGSEAPALTRINPQTLTIERIFRFEASANPYDLEINSTGDTLYFINQGVCKMAIHAKSMPETAFIPGKNRLFYNMGVNPANNEIYAADAIDYTQDAMVYRFSPQGLAIDSFKVGINHSDFLFR